MIHCIPCPAASSRRACCIGIYKFDQLGVLALLHTDIAGDTLMLSKHACVCNTFRDGSCFRAQFANIVREELPYVLEGCIQP